MGSSGYSGANIGESGTNNDDYVSSFFFVPIFIGTLMIRVLTLVSRLPLWVIWLLILVQARTHALGGDTRFFGAIVQNQRMQAC